MYEGKIEVGMVARLDGGVRLLSGAGIRYSLPAAHSWEVLAVDCMDVVLRAGQSPRSAIVIERIADFRRNLIELRAPDGTKLWPVEEKHLVPIAGDPCVQERKISTPDYPLNRVKELEAELAEARKEINRLQAKAGFWNHGYNRQAMELAAAREEIADLHGKLTVYQEANATLSSKVADARKELERWEKAFQEDRKELANLGDCILRECEFDLVDNETATDTAMRIIKTQHIELARRDRLEAGTAKNIRWFKAMAHHLLAGIDLQLEHFGTPEARAKFEKEEEA